MKVIKEAVWILGFEPAVQPEGVLAEEARELEEILKFYFSKL